ncbi:MAG: RimK family alpha-L-glutamate ligase [Bacteroidota bacterium]
MPSCAFLSISNTAGWFIDDDLVHEPLQALGWEVQNTPWDQPTDWNAFDVVIIRSPWDYQDHPEEFIGVLKNIDQSNAILLNSLDLVMWNIDKNYLFELENKGIELVPTRKSISLTKKDIERAFEAFKTNELIIKPMIGANADDTFWINQTDNDLSEIISIFQNRECMIQPFMKNIVEEGEYSLMYFQGNLSHTILKTVKEGDFRIQEEHGGGVIAIEDVEPSLIATANKIMTTLSEPPFYARVDLVRTPRQTFALMELELIEPCLYFRFDDHSAERFANCLDDFWKERVLILK